MVGREQVIGYFLVLFLAWGVVNPQLTQIRFENARLGSWLRAEYEIESGRRASERLTPSTHGASVWMEVQLG